MFRTMLCLSLLAYGFSSFADSIISSPVTPESKKAAVADILAHDTGKKSAVAGEANSERPLSENELEAFRNRVSQMWEEKGYARNREPGERPIMMNKQLAEAIREAHEGKPASLNQMLDELRAQITDKKECEDFFKKFRQAYLKSENYSKARTVLDARDIPTSEIFKKMKEGDKSVEAEYGRRINAIVEAGGGLWSGRQTANLLSAYTHFSTMDAEKKSKTGQEPPADNRVEVIVGYLATGVETANQDKFAEALSKKDGLPCGENLSKDIADVAKALRSEEVGNIPPMNERERHTGVKDPKNEARRKEWQDVKDAARQVPVPIKEALARRNYPSNDPERNAQIAGPKGYLGAIGHVIDSDNIDYLNSKRSNRSGFFDWFAGGPKGQRHYRPTLSEYIGKLATQFEKNGRTKSDTMTEAETELDATLDLLAYVDRETGARSLKVDGKPVPLPKAFDRFGDKPAESDIPSLKGIDWSKSTVAIPKFEETFGPPETAEENQKLFAMQKANAAELIGHNPRDQKQYWDQIQQYWDNRVALYRAKYDRAPEAGMFPTVPTYMSPGEVKAAAERAATEQRIAEQDARIKRLEELLLQQNQKR